MRRAGLLNGFLERTSRISSSTTFSPGFSQHTQTGYRLSALLPTAEGFIFSKRTETKKTCRCQREQSLFLMTKWLLDASFSSYLLSYLPTRTFPCPVPIDPALRLHLGHILIRPPHLLYLFYGKSPSVARLIVAQGSVELLTRERPVRVREPRLFLCSWPI